VLLNQSSNSAITYCNKVRLSIFATHATESRMPPLPGSTVEDDELML
jgi:hypothetical protein